MMGFKNQVTVLVGILLVLVWTWGRIPKPWRFGIALLWGGAMSWVGGHALLNRVRNLGALDLRRETPLPQAVHGPGVAGRSVGPLRLYLALPAEVRLEARTDDAVRSPVFDPKGGAAVPLLVVIENDTYRPLDGEGLGWRGPVLCTVCIEREGGGEVFRTEVPMPDGGIRLLAAERREIEIRWPLDGAVAGDYRASVRLPFGGQARVEAGVRLY